jgi:hypothetical protein
MVIEEVAIDKATKEVIQEVIEAVETEEVSLEVETEEVLEALETEEVSEEGEEVNEKGI